jgi:sn-glycerol 3-phosphate transport system permease protein
MVENRPLLTFLTHLVLILGVAIVAFPVYVALIASTLAEDDFLSGIIPMIPGPHALENYSSMLVTGLSTYGAPPIGPMMINSLVMALSIAIGKIAISILSAYAIVYFRFPFRLLAFWAIFITLMLPVEVRIMPTFAVVANLNMLNSYAGLSIPLIASATATFLFRQFFLTVPDELVEAARVDGAGPLKFFRDILLPLSRTNMAALFVILFIYGWNQYLWPLLFTTDKSMATAILGLTSLVPRNDAIPAWNLAMNAALFVMLPPAVVILILQRWFTKGLVDAGK